MIACSDDGSATRAPECWFLKQELYRRKTSISSNNNYARLYHLRQKLELEIGEEPDTILFGGGLSLADLIDSLLPKCDEKHRKVGCLKVLLFSRKEHSEDGFFPLDIRSLLPTRECVPVSLIRSVPKDKPPLNQEICVYFSNESPVLGSKEFQQIAGTNPHLRLIRLREEQADRFLSGDSEVVDPIRNVAVCASMKCIDYAITRIDFTKGVYPWPERFSNINQITVIREVVDPYSSLNEFISRTKLPLYSFDYFILDTDDDNMQKFFLLCMRDEKERLAKFQLPAKMLEVILKEKYRIYDKNALNERILSDEFPEHNDVPTPGVLPSGEVLGNLESLLLRYSVLGQSVLSKRLDYEDRAQLLIDLCSNVSHSADAIHEKTKHLTDDCRSHANEVLEVLTKAIMRFSSLQETLCAKKHSTNSKRNTAIHALDEFYEKHLLPLYHRFSEEVDRIEKAWRTKETELRGLRASFMRGHTKEFSEKLRTALTDTQQHLWDFRIKLTEDQKESLIFIKKIKDKMQNEQQAINAASYDQAVPDRINVVSKEILDAIAYLLLDS